MHKTKSYQSTFVEAGEGELIKYWDNDNMLIVLEWFQPNPKSNVDALQLV